MIIANSRWQTDVNHEAARGRFDRAAWRMGVGAGSQGEERELDAEPPVVPSPNEGAATHSRDRQNGGAATHCRNDDAPIAFLPLPHASSLSGSENRPRMANGEYAPDDG